MDSDIERLVQSTGVVLPLAASIVRLAVDSGADKMEVSAALAIVHDVLQVLAIKDDHRWPPAVLTQSS